MKNLPKRIYLQIDADGETPEDFKDLSGVSWCADKINDNDIAYVLESEDSEAVEFHEWVGKQGYKLSHYAAKGEAVHLHESKGSTPFHELREGDWRTTKELYQIFKSQS